jgi:hypothetical protein
MFKKLSLGFILLASMYAHADIHNVQGKFLQRDLGSPNQDNYNAQTALNNYLKAIVTDTYSGETPQTFTIVDWRAVNQFNSNNVLNAEYFNSADLGLGRDMHCVAQPQLEAQRGVGAMACYVSNHGKIGGDTKSAFAGLNNPADPEFATVAMEFWPSSARNKVRFFVFGSELDANGDGALDGGRLVTGLNIVLDNGLGHEQPGLCLACHGGELKNTGSSSTIDIQGGHFLPFDTFSFEYETPEKRIAAQPKFDAMNKLVHRAEKSAYSGSSPANRQIYQYLEGSYTPSITSLNATFVDTFTPSQFSANSNNINLYHSVVKQYCRGCHLSSSTELAPASVLLACDANYDMPHAEVTAANFRRHMEFVAHDIDRFASSSACYTMPHLVDFQHEVPTNSLNFEGLNMFQGLSAELSSALSGGDLYSLDKSETLSVVTSDPVVGVNNRRSVLKGGLLDVRQAFMLTKASNPAKAPNINNVSLLMHKRDDKMGVLLVGNAGSSAPLFIEFIDDRTTTANPGTNDSFVRYEKSLAGMGVKRLEVIYTPQSIDRFAAAFQIPGTVEFDDIQITYDAKTPNAQYADFESIFTNPPSNAAMVEHLPSCSLTSNVTGSLGNLIKPGGDSGRYSFQTGPSLCVGDKISILIGMDKPRALLRINDDTGGELSFEFAISKKIQEQSNIIYTARSQGTLIETSKYFTGRVKIKLQPNEGYGADFLVLEDSSINGKPIHGVAIDNIRFVPN